MTERRQILLIEADAGDRDLVAAYLDQTDYALQRRLVVWPGPSATACGGMAELVRVRHPGDADPPRAPVKPDDGRASAGPSVDGRASD